MSIMHQHVQVFVRLYQSQRGINLAWTASTSLLCNLPYNVHNAGFDILSHFIILFPFKMKVYRCSATRLIKMKSATSCSTRLHLQSYTFKYLTFLIVPYSPLPLPGLLPPPPRPPPPPLPPPRPNAPGKNEYGVHI